MLIDLETVDSFDTLRSFPIAGLKALAQEREVSILGGGARELAGELAHGDPGSPRISFGSFMNSPLARVAPVNSPLQRHRSDDSVMDIMICLDRERSIGAIKDTNLLRNVCMKTRGAFVFPVRFDWEPIKVGWGNGFSWAEHLGDNRWIWCSSVELAQASMVIVNSTEEALNVKLQFSCSVAYNYPVQMAIARDGEVIANFQSNQMCDIPILLQPGLNEILWSAECVPETQANRLRSLSFAVLNLHLLDPDGREILAKEAIYQTQDVQCQRQTEIFVRRQLHRAGFVSVAGMMCGKGVFHTASAMANTSGSPSTPAPFDFIANRWYSGAEEATLKNGVAWMLASPLVGHSFNKLRTALFTDA